MRLGNAFQQSQYTLSRTHKSKKLDIVKKLILNMCAAAQQVYSCLRNRLKACTALKHRAKGDYANMMLKIADEFYPSCDRIIVVSGNLNTHDKASFYEAFPPKTAYRLSQNFVLYCIRVIKISLID